ncbi:MAG: SHOCT domain-containing protein [Candidatus Limnocylindrales bacterium]
MMGYGTGLGLGSGLGGWVMMLGGMAAIVGLILMIAWAVGRAGGSSATNPSFPAQGFTPTAGSPSSPDAMEVLRLRLARGEISAEEFAATKQTLEGGQ